MKVGYKLQAINTNAKMSKLIEKLTSFKQKIRSSKSIL